MTLESARLSTPWGRALVVGAVTAVTFAAVAAVLLFAASAVGARLDAAAPPVGAVTPVTSSDSAPCARAA